MGNHVQTWGVGEIQITLFLGNAKSSWENESFIVFLVKPFLVVEGQPIGAKIRSVLFPSQGPLQGKSLEYLCQNCQNFMLMEPGNKYS